MTTYISVTCVNTRNNNDGDTCGAQIGEGGTCQNYLLSKECDKECNLCSCSTSAGATSEHCSGHGECEASCTKTSCSSAKCKCEPGWTGNKCETPGNLMCSIKIYQPSNSLYLLSIKYSGI